MTAAEVAAFVAASESYEGWLDAGIIGADRNEIMAKLVIAAADYGYQWWRTHQDLMMTKEELP